MECKNCKKYFIDTEDIDNKSSWACPNCGDINEGQLETQVRLPPIDNAIVVMFEDGIKKVRIETTPYMWDIIKALGEEKALQFIKKNNETGETLIITIEMETERAI